MTYGHLQADCLYTGISSGPNAWYRVWEAFTFYLFSYMDQGRVPDTGVAIDVKSSNNYADVKNVTQTRQRFLNTYKRRKT